MKNGGDQWQVDDSLLTETGRGGLFTDGYLQGRPLESYFERGETPLFVFGDGKRGVTRVDDGDTERIVPASGFRAMTAITDRHVQMVVGGGGHDDEDWAKSIRLADVDRVSVEEGLIRDQLSLWVDGVEWQVHLKDVDTDRVVPFLEDVSWAWIQVEREIDQARKRLVDAGQHQKSREYEAAEESLTAARRLLAEASEAVETVPEAAADGMTERVAQIESRYRDTKRRLHASRATHLVDEAERYWRDDEFEAAHETFVRAREQYEAVLDIYGLQPDKEAAMRDRIEHVEANLELLGSAPLDRAHETRKRALAAEDTEAALDAWSEVLERYRTVIELDWGVDEKRFEGDVDLARDRVVEAVERRLEARHTLADQCRDRGDGHIQDGDVGAARDAYSEAISHLEAAEELAREFDPDALDRIDDRLEDLASCIESAAEDVARASAQADDEAATEDDEYSDFDNWVTLSPDDEDEAAEETVEESGGPSDEEMSAPSPDDAGEALADGSPEAVEAVGFDGPERAPVEAMADVSDPFATDQHEPQADVVDTVRSLSDRVLIEVAEAVWSALAWTTEERTVDGEPVVCATREQPDRTTMVVAVAQAATADAVDRAVDISDSAEADRVTLLTTGGTSDGADRRAIEAGVELLEPVAFARMLENEDLTDLLPDATA